MNAGCGSLLKDLVDAQNNLGQYPARVHPEEMSPSISPETGQKTNLPERREQERHYNLDDVRPSLPLPFIRSRPEEMVEGAGLGPGDPVECGSCPCGRGGNGCLSVSLVVRGKPPVILYCQEVNSDEKRSHSAARWLRLGEDRSKMMDRRFRGCMLMSSLLSGASGRQLQVSSPPAAQPACRSWPLPLTSPPSFSP